MPCGGPWNKDEGTDAHRDSNENETEVEGLKLDEPWANAQGSPVMMGESDGGCQLKTGRSAEFLSVAEAWLAGPVVLATGDGAQPHEQVI